MVVTKGQNCKDNSELLLSEADTMATNDDAIQVTKPKPKTSKTVHFAPDVKPAPEAESRMSHAKRMPSATLFNLNVLKDRADQLPAVVEKYMIRSLPAFPESKVSVSQDSTANIIYIDNVGMRYKSGDRPKEHPLSRSLDLSHLGHKGHAQRNSEPAKLAANSHRTSAMKKTNSDSLSSSSSSTVQIKTGQQRTNQCRGQKTTANVDAGVPSTIDKSSSQSSPPTKKNLDRRKHGFGTSSKDSRRVNLPRTSKHRPAMSRTHDGVSKVDITQGVASDSKNISVRIAKEGAS